MAQSCGGLQVPVAWLAWCARSPYHQSRERIRRAQKISQSPPHDHRRNFLASQISASEQKRFALVQSRGRHADSRRMPLAGKSAVPPNADSASRLGRVERIRLYARHRRESLRFRIQRGSPEPAKLWRHRKTNYNSLPFRLERRYQGCPARTNRPRSLAGSLRRRLFHGRQSGSEDGRRIRRSRASAIAGIRGCRSRS